MDMSELNTTPQSATPEPQAPVYDEKIIHFMRWRKPMAIFSLLVVLIGLVSLVTRGLNLGLDFTGGVSAELNYSQPVTQQQVQQALTTAGFKDPVVQFLGNQRDLLVRMPPQEATNLSQRLTQAAALPNNTVSVQKVDAVGGQVAVPQGPGLGHDPDSAILARYAVTSPTVLRAQKDAT